jgi:ribosomal protein L34
LISSSLYRAHANSFNQQLTIKNIWNGSHSSPINWGKYNFTDENVINQPSPAHVKSDLTFVGNNKVYYIGNDNRIHGYIKVSDAWLTVSPSYAAHYAGQNINSQVQAAGDLISNPSGTFLYYRGTDGYVYRYQVNNDWSYTYSAMPTNSSMQQQGITAVNSLICPSDSRIYYIANEPSNGNAKRVHGFIRNVSTGNWSTISPSYSAHYAGQSINSQVQAAGNLISNPSGTFLYYKGIDGYVYRYQITDDLNYTYSAMPTNSAMQQQGITVVSSLICPINDRIYYIANEPSNGNAKRVHGFARNVSTGNWSTISPSYSAHYAGQSINSQAQATTSVTLAYNPDNSTLIYTGLDNQLHGFNVINSIDYTYFNIMQVSYNQRPTNSLKFKEANNVYYISSGDAKIHYFKFSENYCANAIVQQVEPNCCQSADNYLYGKENDKNIYDGIILNSNEKRILTVFPNPSNDIISIKLNIKNDSNTVVRIISTEGLLMREFLTFEEITQINLAEFPNGIYYIVTSSGEGTLTAKFIVQH